MNPTLGAGVQTVELGVKPDCDHRAVLVGLVRLGGMKHSRVTYNEIAGVNRQVQFGGVIQEARIIRVRATIDLRSVGLTQVVKDMTFPVGSGQNPTTGYG